MLPRLTGGLTNFPRSLRLRPARFPRRQRSRILRPYLLDSMRKPDRRRTATTPYPFGDLWGPFLVVVWVDNFSNRQFSRCGAHPSVEAVHAIPLLTLGNAPILSAVGPSRPARRRDG